MIKWIIRENDHPNQTHWAIENQKTCKKTDQTENDLQMGIYQFNYIYPSKNDQIEIKLGLVKKMIFTYEIYK
jgi:hypothetical protein